MPVVEQPHELNVHGVQRADLLFDFSGLVAGRVLQRGQVQIPERRDSRIFFTSGSGMSNARSLRMNVSSVAANPFIACEHLRRGGYALGCW